MHVESKDFHTQGRGTRCTSLTEEGQKKREEDSCVWISRSLMMTSSGVPSWGAFYPFLYAPLASDLKEMFAKNLADPAAGIKPPAFLSDPKARGDDVITRHPQLFDLICSFRRAIHSAAAAACCAATRERLVAATRISTPGFRGRPRAH